MRFKIVTVASLLAACVLLPGCDLLNPNPCDPNVEVCVFTGNNPSTLDPNPGR